MKPDRGERRALRGHHRRQRRTRREARATTATSSRPAPTPARSSAGRSGRRRPVARRSSRSSATTGSPVPTRTIRTSRTGPRTSPVATSGGRYQKDTYCCAERHDVGGLPEPVVRVRRRQRALLHARRRVGRPEHRHRHAVRQRLPRALDHVEPRVPVAQGRPPRAPVGPEVRVLPLPDLLGPAGREQRHLAAGQRQPRGPARVERRRTSRSAATRTSTSATRRRRQEPSEPRQLRHRRRRRRRPVRSASPCSANDKYAIGWSDTNGAGIEVRCRAGPDLTNPGLPLPQGHGLRLHRHRDADRRARPHVRRADLQLHDRSPTRSSTAAPPVGHHQHGCDLHVPRQRGRARRSRASSTPLPRVRARARSRTPGSRRVCTRSRVYSTVGGTSDPIPATYNVDRRHRASDGAGGLHRERHLAVLSDADVERRHRQHRRYRLRRVPRRRLAHHGRADARATSTPPSSARRPHTYAVRARDVAGNVSPFTATITVTTPAPPPPIFADGFESGDLSAWTTSSGLVVETTTVHGGTKAAEGNTVNGNTYAKKTLPSTYTDAFARVWYNVIGQSDQVNLLRMRDAARCVVRLPLHHNERRARVPQRRHGHQHRERHDPGSGLARARAPSQDDRHERRRRGLARQRAASPTSRAWRSILGTSPVGGSRSARPKPAAPTTSCSTTPAFGTSRLGPAGDTAAPSVPTGVIATATFAVLRAPRLDRVDRQRRCDCVRRVPRRRVPRRRWVRGHDLHRHHGRWRRPRYSYAVRARDLAGNVSALSAPSSVTTPAPRATDLRRRIRVGRHSGVDDERRPRGARFAECEPDAFAAEGNTTNGGVFAKRDPRRPRTPTATRGLRSTS